MEHIRKKLAELNSSLKASIDLSSEVTIPDDLSVLEKFLDNPLGFKIAEKTDDVFDRLCEECLTPYGKAQIFRKMVFETWKKDERLAFTQSLFSRTLVLASSPKHNQIDDSLGIVAQFSTPEMFEIQLWYSMTINEIDTEENADLVCEELAALSAVSNILKIRLRCSSNLVDPGQADD